MNIDNHILENRQGGTEEHRAEQAEPAKQDSAQAELITPTYSEAKVSERGVENEIPDNVRSKDDDKNENVDDVKKKADARLADIFDFRHITYFHLAEWTTRESKGVMEVLEDQSDDQAVLAPLVNKDGEKDDITASNKNAKQDKNIGVLSPSWSKTKALQLMIHSPALIANLKGIDRKLSWHAHMTNHDERFQRVVFIRPFKFLILREAEIRERFEELDKYRAKLPLPPPDEQTKFHPIPPPPISPPLSVLDSPLQTVGPAAIDSGDLQSELNISEIRNEETLDEHSHAQRDEETIVTKTEDPLGVIAEVQENENQDSEIQALVSVVSEEVSKDKATSGVDAGREAPSQTTEHLQKGEQSSTEQVTDTLKDSDLRVVSPRDIAVSKADQSNLEKILWQQKSVIKELEIAKDIAEAEAKRLKPSDPPKAPIKFKDAVGRKFSFPWHICKSWKGMEELIKQAFLSIDVIGPHVFEGHYDLMGPDGEIILPQIWETLVQPDWSITMHMWPMPESSPPPPEDDGLILRNSQDALEDFRLLIRFLDEDLKPIIDMRKQIKEGTLDKIAFDDLWHLFHYGEEVIWHDQDKSSMEKPRAARVLKFTGGRSTKADHHQYYNPSRTGVGALGPGSWGYAFVVQCWTMTFDGSFFWPEEVLVGIRPYEGEKDISTLPIYPSKFDRAGLLADLIEHGKIYRHFTQQTFSHRKYLGKNYKGDRGEDIDSEVIIDFREASSSMSQRDYESAPEFESPETNQVGHDMRELWVEYPEHGLCEQKGWCIREVIGPDFALDELELGTFLRDNNHIMQAKETIKDSEVAILPDRVPGYILNRKIWAMLSTSKSNLMEFQATSDPWNDLVLEKKQKVIIEALVAKHLHQPTNSNELDTPFQLGDFVAGKGRSIVLLLHGPPGVGKTSTAECIAAHMEKPLYPLTSGNLPVRANDLEEQLQVHFNLAARWGCILLLDEADVFLQRRRLNELEINAMVSVFLRQLEYYRGILFLTTNRVGDIDPAFKSRIHVSLEYEPLDRKRTKKIYELHLRRIKEALELRKNTYGTAFKVKGREILAWSDQHFKRASKIHRQWNGRQIHNAFQTAVALAEWEGRTKFPESHEQGTRNFPQLVLGKKQFKQVSQVSEGFDQYMTDLMGGRNEAELAAVSAQRYDFRLGKTGESQSKKNDRSDSDSDDSSGGESEDEEGNSSEDESSDSDVRPKRGQGNSKKNESESRQTSDDGKKKRNKTKGRGSQRTKLNSDSSEELVKSKGVKDAEKNKKKAKSKQKGSISDSD